MSSVRSVKASLGQDIRRFGFEHCSFDLLKDTIGSLFKLQTPFVLKYQDDENDWISISSDQELAVAFSLFQQKSLRVEVIVENSNGMNLPPQQPSIPDSPSDTMVSTPVYSDTMISTPVYSDTMVSAPVYPSVQPPLFPIPTSSPICATKASLKNLKLVMKEEKRKQKFDKKFDKLERKKEHWNEKMKRETTRLVGDVTFPDNSKISPNTSFVKVWRIRNESNIPWSPSECVFFLQKGPTNE